MSIIHTPRRPAIDARMLLFPVAIAMLLLVLFLRLWYIQVVIAPQLAERAEIFGKTRVSIPAPRGLIYDRNGRLVAGIQSQLVLMATPALVLKNPWVIQKLSTMLSQGGAKTTDPDRLLRKTRDGLYKPYVPTPIFTGVPIEVAAKISESTGSLPGIAIESQPTRFYPDSISLSHVLGYVWVPSPNDVARAKNEGRPVGQFVGKGGLEWVYEKELTGADGYEAMLVDARQRPLRIAERSNPLPGSQLILSIDSELQRTAVRALGNHRGAVVALDPDSGEVLCMASTPTFDLALFKNGISQEDFAALNNSPEHPFINRAVASAFSPGSTFKIVTTVAAIRAGVFDPNRVTFCAGGYSLGRAYYRCLGHHGAMQFRDALERSCNTYFSDLAMRTGKDYLRETALAMGFFGKSHIDLQFERTGLIPTDAFLARAHRPWVPGYAVLMGIGQGDVLATPLQMANLAAFVANGGVTYVPHLVRAVRHGLDNEAVPVPRQVLREVNIPIEKWNLIREAMVGVVQHGTAAGSQISGLVWAGKTGSAEVRGQSKTNSWFIGYAPADKPRIAICVMVEAVGHGSEFAAPIAKQVVQGYLFPPSAPSNSVTALSAHAAPAASPAER